MRINFEFSHTFDWVVQLSSMKWRILSTVRVFHANLCTSDSQTKIFTIQCTIRWYLLTPFRMLGINTCWSLCLSVSTGTLISNSQSAVIAILLSTVLTENTFVLLDCASIAWANTTKWMPTADGHLNDDRTPYLFSAHCLCFVFWLEISSLSKLFEHLCVVL